MLQFIQSVKCDVSEEKLFELVSLYLLKYYKVLEECLV